MPVDYPAQQRLIESLRDPGCYPHAAKSVRLMETHISWVLLVGRYAYKIKKAVNLGFLDFTDLDARRFYCEEEIRLNRRFAPQLYLDVIAIGGNPVKPELGANPAIEYAVRMRRFASSRLMDCLATRGKVTPAHMDSLAATLSRFHTSLPPAPQDSAFGTLVAIRAPMAQNFEQLSPLLNAGNAAMLARLIQASEGEYAACVALFEQRKQEGRVRECHGDLHLGNIVLINNQPVLFDGIEFNTSFRWIDVMSEVAFLVMDLLHRNRTDLAFRFLNGYLETTGDYQGVGVLRFYLAYRAMVRAKVNAMRAHQADAKLKETRQTMAACRSYLALAETSLILRHPALIITHGLPGCGKTTVAQVVLEHLEAIRIRSDVERKRLFGLTPLEDSRSRIGDGIYSEEATQRTYAQLLALAHSLLSAGFPVIVDAAFLRHTEREQFRALAQGMSIPFVILSVKAGTSILSSRIVQRTDHGRDASEADLEVLKHLQAAHEPLRVPELACTVEFVNNGEVGEISAKMKFWDTLEKLLCGHPSH